MGHPVPSRLLLWFASEARPPAGRTTLFDLLVPELCPQTRHFQTRGQGEKAKSSAKGGNWDAGELLGPTKRDPRFSDPGGTAWRTLLGHRKEPNRFGAKSDRTRATRPAPAPPSPLRCRLVFVFGPAPRPGARATGTPSPPRGSGPRLSGPRCATGWRRTPPSRAAPRVRRRDHPGHRVCPGGPPAEP